jgi:Phage tail assembly chaperone, TAC
MILSIDSLKDMGAFTGAPVEREITWRQGEDEHTATVFVRLLSYRSAVSDITSAVSNSDPVAGRIAASICDEKGHPVFTVDDITGDADPDRGPLSGSLTMALLQVIGEVNGLGKSES